MVDNYSHGQQERLAFIDFSLQYFGHVSRTDLIQRFKTGLAASTRDFSAYKSLAPDNMVLVHQTKNYYRTAAFKPVYEHNPEVILTSLSRGFGNGISSAVQPSEQCFDAVRLIHPDAEIIAALMRAIHNQQAIECGYVSLTSGESTRQLVPHALVNNGHRWHVRAFDRKTSGFRDFVCTRFTQVKAIEQPISSQEQRSADTQWHALVELVLVPHPSIEHNKAIQMDYGMQDGQKRLTVRAALAAYLLRQWQVDCSKQHRFTGQGCQLALANPESLANIENIALAPGYGH